MRSNRLGSRSALSLCRVMAGLAVALVAGASAHAQQCLGYSISAGSATFTPGTTDIGNHCDDCVTAITLPFNVNFYGTAYTTANVGSNGTFQFATGSTSFGNVCWPASGIQAGFGPTIFPFWDDLYTSGTAQGQGVFTSLTGTSPNQVFVVEWRTGYCCTAAAPVNDFEIKFYEGQGYFDVVYGSPMSDRVSATIGVQDGAGQFAQFECNAAGPTSGASLHFSCLNSSTAGACCNTSTGTCSVANQADCSPAANFLGVGVACPGTCPTSGACCNPSSGVCSITGPSGCGSPGVFQASGTVCSPNPCPQPPTGACCDTATGACTSVFAVNCPAATSSFQGNNTSCPGTLCNPVGSCCSPAGNCSARYGSSCASGLTINAAASCSPTLCSRSAGTVCESFDAGSVGSLPSNWSSTSTGAGTAWAIDSTQSNSAPNAVFTNDPATVSSQFLVLPTVTVGASGTVTVDFFSYFDTEATYDGFVVEFSTDGGNNWTDLVNSGSWSLNGYNQAAISTAFQSPIAGRPAFSGVFTSWTEHIGVINATAGSQMMIRFQMASDNSVTHVGVWLDNICVNSGQVQGGSGVCCRGATCSTTVAQGSCTGSGMAGAAFVSSSSTCNTGTSTTSPCCYANYNKVNSITVQDIFDFLNDWFAGSPYARTGGDGSPALLAVQNIFDFLNAWFAGGCS